MLCVLLDSSVRKRRPEESTRSKPDKYYGRFRHQTKLGRHTLSCIIQHETALLGRSRLNVLPSHRHCKWRGLRPLTSGGLSHEMMHRVTKGCCSAIWLCGISRRMLPTLSCAKARMTVAFDGHSGAGLVLQPLCCCVSNCQPQRHQLEPIPTRR